MIFIENRQSHQNCETLLMESYNDDNFSENELLRAALQYYTRGKRDCSQKVHFPRRRRFAICLKNPCHMNISFSPRGSKYHLVHNGSFHKFLSFEKLP